MHASVLIFIGAGLGGLLRYWVGVGVQRWWSAAATGVLSGGFPLGTLLVNVSGCLVMGFLGALWAGGGSGVGAGAVAGSGVVQDGRESLRLLLMVGVLGGYTTFSSFGRETLLLTQQGEWGQAGFYVGASVVLSLAAVWAGAALASFWR